jgi:hypothetical protein
MGAGSTKFGVMEKWIMMDDTVAGREVPNLA